MRRNSHRHTPLWTIGVLRAGPLSVRSVNPSSHDCALRLIRGTLVLRIVLPPEKKGQQ